MVHQMGGSGAQEEKNLVTQFTLEEPMEEDQHSGYLVVSKLPPSYELVTSHHSVRVFQVKCSDEYCIRTMLDLRHRNILRIESVIDRAEETTEYTLLVEQYEGNLKTYFEEKMSASFSSLDVIHSMQKIFRQVFDGIVYLMDHEFHHAGFSLKDTYYCRKAEPVVKLANFKEWKMSVWPSTFEQRCTDDWFSVGMAVDEVATMLIDKGPQGQANKPYTREMKELAVFLKNRNIDAVVKKKLVYEQTFLWTPEKRASFFTYNIPTLFKDKTFSGMVAERLNVPSTFLWDETSFFGLLRIMNGYRFKKYHKKYTGVKKTHYLKFVCGSYTHENQFKRKWNLTASVDRIFRTCNPELCADVMAIVNSFEAAKRKEAQKGQK